MKIIKLGVKGGALMGIYSSTTSFPIGYGMRTYQYQILTYNGAEFAFRKFV